MRIVCSVFQLCVIAVCLLPSHSFAHESGAGTPHVWWINSGGGYAHTDDPFGLSLAACNSHVFGIHQLTIRSAYISEVNILGEGLPYEYALDLGLLYGPRWSPTLFVKHRESRDPVWWSMSVSFSGGIGGAFGVTRGKLIASHGFFDNDYEAVPFSEPSLPLQLEACLIPHSRLGIAINASANINNTQNFFATWIGLQYGLLRDRDDLQRAVAWKNLSTEARIKKTIVRSSLGLTALCCAAVSVGCYLRSMDADRSSEDYDEMRSYTSEDYAKYDKMYKEERELVRDRIRAGNVFAALFAAGLGGLALSFEY